MGLNLLRIFLGMGTGLVFGAGMGFVIDTGILNLTLGGGIGFVLGPTLRIGFGVEMGSALRTCSVTVSLLTLPLRKPFRSLLRRASRDGSRPFRRKYFSISCLSNISFRESNSSP